MPLLALAATLFLSLASFCGGMRDANVEGLLELDDVAGSQSTTTNGPEQEQEPAPLTGVDRLLRQREAWFELMREAELMSADETDETDETDGGVDDECMRDISQGRSCTKWDDRAKGRNGLKTGDMLFFSDNKIKSKMQRFFSGKLVTHVGTVVWNKWDKIENRFVYVTAWEPDAILTLMEVSNHKNRDIETHVSRDGFQNGDVYQKLQHQPKGTRIFVRPLKVPLNQTALRDFTTISGCLHARRPDYLKWFATSESTLGKFSAAWLESAKEKDELYKRMFCSQFVALLVESWGGALKLGGDEKDTPVLWQPKDPHDVVLLPGDFDPGNVRDIENNMYGELYQIQIPYDFYDEYRTEASEQRALLQGVGPSRYDFVRQCSEGIERIGFVHRYLPTWAKEMRQTIEVATRTTSSQ